MPRAIPNPESVTSRSPRTKPGEEPAGGTARPGGAGRATAFLIEPGSGLESPLLTPGVGDLLRNGDSVSVPALQAENRAACAR